VITMVTIKEFPVLRDYAETGQRWSIPNDVQI